jgi:Na+/proline symporter
VLGFGVTVLWILQFKADTFDLYEMIPGFFVGLLTILIVSRMTWREPEGRQVMHPTANGHRKTGASKN